MRIPKMRIPKMRIPKVKIPKMRIPKMKIPKMRIPKIRIPKMRIPKNKNEIKFPIFFLILYKLVYVPKQVYDFKLLPKRSMQYLFIVGLKC